MNRKTGFVFTLLLCLLVSAAGIVADETVPFPFWQHGWGCTTFWSLANYGGSGTAYADLRLFNLDGELVAYTFGGAVPPGQAWMPDTALWGGSWYSAGNNVGFGIIEIEHNENSVYLWGCIYGALDPAGQAGYTIVFPQNPYGMPDE